MPDDESVRYLVDRMHEVLKVNASSGNTEDCTAWPKRLSIDDSLITAFRPNSYPRVEIDLLYTFQHTSVACCVAFSKDGKYLATGCNRACQLFDVVTGKLLCVMTPEVGSDKDMYCRCVCFSPDDRVLVNGWEEGAVKLWSVDRKGCGVMTGELLGHQQDIYDLDFSNDGFTVASCSDDRSLKLWDARSGDCLRTLATDDELTSVEISPNSTFVVAGSSSKVAYIWEVSTGHRIATLKGHTDSLSSVHFMSSNQIITAALDEIVMLWQIPELDAPNRESYEHLLDTEKMIAPHESFVGHSDFVLCTTSTFDQRWILSGSKDRSVRFWDPNKGTCSTVLLGHKNSVISLVAHPTGRFFATASGDMRMRLWRYREVDGAGLDTAKRSDLYSILT